MTEKKNILIILFLLPYFIGMVSGNEGHSFNFIEFLAKTINFIILIGGLAYFLLKPIRNFLEKRIQDIKRTLKDTKKSKQEAEQKLQEVKERLSGLEDEIVKIKKEAEIEGLREKEKTIQLAKQEAERIKHFAQQAIEMIIQTGIQELKEYTAGLATELAEERIRKKLGSEDQIIYIDECIERLDELYENPNSDKEIHSRVS